MSDRVVIFRWPDVKGHLELELANLHKKMEMAETDRELWDLRGQCKALRKLLNLPDTLSFLRE